MTDIQRPPPHSQEAEQGVLGSILCDCKAIAKAAQILKPEHFYVPAHQTIYVLLLELWTAGKPIDLITFTQTLRDRNVLEQVGGAPGVTALFTFVPSSANLDYYAEIVRDKYVLRSIIAAGTQSAANAQESEDAAETLAQTQKAFADIASSRIARADRKTFKQLMLEKLERMDNPVKQDNCIPTGLVKLDKLSPVFPGDFPLLMAERKTGKTILALNISVNAAAEGKRVLYFSLEDRANKVADRIFAMRTRVPMFKQRSLELTPQEVKCCGAVAGHLSEFPITLVDDAFDLIDVVALAREHNTRHKLSLIVVDYAQLIRVPEGRDNRERAVASISRTLRLLGMELDVAVLLLSQINEAGRARESRALEQDCTAVWWLRHDMEEDGPNVRWLDIPAQRNGESGIKFPLHFSGEIAFFGNYQEEEKE